MVWLSCGLSYKETIFLLLLYFYNYLFCCYPPQVPQIIFLYHLSKLRYRKPKSIKKPILFQFDTSAFFIASWAASGLYGRFLIWGWRFHKSGTQHRGVRTHLKWKTTIAANSMQLNSIDEFYARRILEIVRVGSALAILVPNCLVVGKRLVIRRSHIRITKSDI